MTCYSDYVPSRPYTPIDSDNHISCWLGKLPVDNNFESAYLVGPSDDLPPSGYSTHEFETHLHPSEDLRYEYSQPSYQVNNPSPYPQHSYASPNPQFLPFNSAPVSSIRPVPTRPSQISSPWLASQPQPASAPVARWTSQGSSPTDQQLLEEYHMELEALAQAKRNLFNSMNNLFGTSCHPSTMAALARLASSLGLNVPPSGSASAPGQAYSYDAPYARGSA
ncbi:unnamed protein product [Rhizoctonia solani]|uniref:Uncharacterized protein n=1 Tax=Rhizoctonia solani TaxID=456999 RepID=A0A8H3HZA6_9AGAM|nr:unnamed protein product [Rhizoctonia solani]